MRRPLSGDSLDKTVSSRKGVESSGRDVAGKTLHRFPAAQLIHSRTQLRQGNRLDLVARTGRSAPLALTARGEPCGMTFQRVDHIVDALTSRRNRLANRGFPAAGGHIAEAEREHALEFANRLIGA